VRRPCKGSGGTAGAPARRWQVQEPAPLLCLSSCFAAVGVRTLTAGYDYGELQEYLAKLVSGGLVSSQGRGLSLPGRPSPDRPLCQRAPS
jgi:hypothetical protein